MTDHALAYLHSHGIPVADHKTHILAWGCVKIVLRPGVWDAVRQHWIWRFTSRQRVSRLSDVHAVMLEMEGAYYLFSSDHTALYRDGQLKTAITFAPDRGPDRRKDYEMLDGGAMARAEDNTGLLFEALARHMQSLKNGAGSRLPQENE